MSTIKDTRVAVYTPELGATPLIHPSRIRLDTPSYSLMVSKLETGDTGTWYCRVDGGSKQVTAYHLKVTGEHFKQRCQWVRIEKLNFSFNSNVLITQSINKAYL